MSDHETGMVRSFVAAALRAIPSRHIRTILGTLSVLSILVAVRDCRAFIESPLALVLCVAMLVLGLAYEWRPTRRVLAISGAVLGFVVLLAAVPWILQWSNQQWSLRSSETPQREP